MEKNIGEHSIMEDSQQCKKEKHKMKRKPTALESLHAPHNHLNENKVLDGSPVCYDSRILSQALSSQYVVDLISEEDLSDGQKNNVPKDESNFICLLDSSPSNQIENEDDIYCIQPTCSEQDEKVHATCSLTNELMSTEITTNPRSGQEIQKGIQIRLKEDNEKKKGEQSEIGGEGGEGGKNSQEKHSDIFFQDEIIGDTKDIVCYASQREDSTRIADKYSKGADGAPQLGSEPNISLTEVSVSYPDSLHLDDEVDDSATNKSNTICRDKYSSVTNGSLKSPIKLIEPMKGHFNCNLDDSLHLDDEEEKDAETESGNNPRIFRKEKDLFCTEKAEIDDEFHTDNHFGRKDIASRQCQDNLHLDDSDTDLREDTPKGEYTKNFSSLLVDAHASRNGNEKKRKRTFTLEAHNALYPDTNEDPHSLNHSLSRNGEAFESMISFDFIDQLMSASVNNHWGSKAEPAKDTEDGSLFQKCSDLVSLFTIGQRDLNDLLKKIENAENPNSLVECVDVSLIYF